MEELITELDSKIGEGNVGTPYFINPEIKSFPISTNNIKRIMEENSERRLAFVDGGNQEIIGAPNFSLQLNRVYVGIWNGKTRVIAKIPKIEFFSATYSSFKDNEIRYETTISCENQEFIKYLPSTKDMSFSSMDRTIRNGNERADIVRVASITRRFAEWKFASNILKSLKKGDVLVMDGTLQTSFTNEGKYLRELINESKNNGVILSGLSKTSNLFTTTGYSLLGAVREIAEKYDSETEWYCPIADSNIIDYNVIILAVKLNSSSKRVYRYEFQREQFQELNETQINEILAKLIQNSSDSSLLGYPYGLIDADFFARVTNSELNYYQSTAISRISKLGKIDKFARHLNSNDTHNILNKLIKW